MTGGTSWVQQNTGAPDKFWGMDLVGTGAIWAVGESGQIVRTTDGGTSWTVQRTVVGQHLYRVDAYDANNVIAAGASGLVVRTTDGGATWNVIATPTAQTLDGVHMFSATHWMIVGYGRDEQRGQLVADARVRHRQRPAGAVGTGRRLDLGRRRGRHGTARTRHADRRLRRCRR